MDRRRVISTSIIALLTISPALIQPARAQVNASGRWSVTIETELGPIGPDVEEWVQTGNTLSSPPWTGTIDPVTGVFTQTAHPPFPILCPADTRTGIVSPDGRTFSAGGIGHVFLPGRCAEFPGTFSGTRLCGNGLIDDEEECDDLNLDDGDGCSFLCEVEQCFACTGEPSSCEMSPQSACDDGNVCTVNDRCDQVGFCAGVHPADGCIGDCDCNGVVSINELVLGVSLVLSGDRPTACPAFDPLDLGQVTIVNIVRGSLNLLHGCAEGFSRDRDSG